MDGPRSQLVIVALPSANDRVRKLSSEKEPHLTLLYLGDPGYDVEQMDHIKEYFAYASTLLPQFTLDVERRGLLGEKDADVLFFHKRWSKEISTFREHLLQDPLISAAYNAIDQFEGWTPHLTMGYPETPSKEDEHGYDEVMYVKFDRVALWTGESEGPTFELSQHNYDMEVAMSQIKSPRTVMRASGTTITHSGVKGMKWGVRKDDSSGGGASTPTPRASADFKTAASAQNKIDNAGTHTLSNQELQGLLTRMNLERQYHSMTTQQHQSELDRGLDTVKKVLKVGKTVNDVRKFLETPTGKAVKVGVKGAFAAASAYATGGTSAAVKVGVGVAVRQTAKHYKNTGN